MRTSIILLYQDLVVFGRITAFVAAFVLMTSLVLTLCVGVLVIFRPASASAIQSIPYLVNFQGRLSDSSGNILADGSYNIKLRLFNTATGGAVAWEEDRTFNATDDRITVHDGLFNIQLGSLTSLSPSLFNEATEGNLYLEVELPTPASATCASNGCAVWTEGAMTPRQPLASSTYAFNSDTLDGLDSSAFVQLSLGTAQPGSIHVAGNIQSDGSLQGSTATLSGTNSLTLGATTGGALGQITFNNGANSNITILQSGSTGPPVLSLTLPSADGSAGDCLKDSDGAGLLGFATCGSATTLQNVYDNSSSPAQITTSSASKALIVQSGTGNNSTTAFAVIPDGTSTPALDVDTQNSRVGIGTATPAETLDVAGAVKIGNTTNSNAGTIRFNGSQFEGYDGAAWLPLNAADVVANQIITAYKASDQTVNNSATLTSDNDLTFAIGANQKWDFHMNLAGNSATAADFKFSIAAPSGATCNWAASEAENSDSAANLACGSSSSVMSGSGADDQYTVDGWVQTGVTAGNVTLQWAQNTANASNSIIRAGSFLQAIQDSGGSLNPFVQGGNSFGTTAVLGTSDSNDVSIVSNGAEGLHLDTSGNVGVGGVTSDGAALDLNGDLELVGVGAPSVAPTGEGRIYFDSTTGHFRVSESGGSYADLLGVTGANASLSNLSSVAINAALLTGTNNSLDIGAAANAFRSGYFGTGLQTPSLAAANNTDLALQTTGTGNLNLSSGSGTVNLAATTIKTTSQPSLTFDINSAINSTLFVTNSNAGHVANLDVSGSLNLGSGQQISFNGTQISSADLSNDASITKQGNSFNGTSQLVQTDGSGNLPSLSGTNLTNLNASSLATGSGAVSLASGGSSALTLTSASGTVSLGSNTLQRAGPALALDLATAGTSQLSVLNSNGSNVANLNVSGGLIIGAGQAVTVGATPGTGISCSGGQILQNQAVSGGIVTGGTCTSAGANTTLSNLGTVAADANLSPDATANNRTLGDATHLWADGYFGTSLFSPSFSGTGAVSVSSGGTSDLTLDSLSGNLILGTNTTTIQKAANLFTIDLATASSSTLDLINSNGANVANLSVEGGVDIGSGRVFSVSGTTGLSRACTTGQILDGFTTTGGIITGGTCTSLAGDKLLSVWTSQQATTATNTQTTLQFTGAANSNPSFNNATHVLTLPSNASKLIIETKGGGGGGGSTGTTTAIKAAAGGGEGASSQKYILGSLAANYYFKVGGLGAGGASGGTNVGTAGSSSCFGANAGNACTTPIASAVGGSGGAASNSAAAAAGGAGGSAAAGIGDVSTSGNPGCNSTAATAGIQSGCGGGEGGGLGLATTAAAGNAGTTGGGGSGALQNTSSAVSRAGGSGGDGYIKITIYTPAADATGGAGSETLQNAYDLSTSPEFTLSSANGGLTVRDSSGGIGGNLLEVQDNSGTTNYLAVTTSGISTSGTVTVATGQTYNVGAATGQDSSVSCSAGQAVTSAIFTGGVLTTAPTCSSVGAGGGADTSLSNLGTVAANANLSPDATANNRDLGDATHLWSTGYFSTGLQAPQLASATGTDLSLQSTGSGNLNLSSGSGALNLSAAAVKTTGQASLTFDLNDAGTSTLFVKNSNASHVANLDITGGLNLGSGQQISFNGTQISSADLSNDSSITKQGNSFNGTSQLVQTDSSGHLPALSGANLTSLDSSSLATGSGSVSLASGAGGPLSLASASGTISLGSGIIQRTASALTLDLSTAGTSTLTVSNSNGSNVANIAASGSIGAGTGGAFSVGASSGTGVTCSGGQFLQNQTVVGGIVTSGTCAAATGGDLQNAYDASATPAAITLSDGKDFVVDAADTTTDPNVLFNLQCTTSCGSNGRFAVQDSGADVLTVNPTGQVVVKPTAGQDLSINLSSSSSVAISSTSAPVTDQVSIDNSGTSGVTTNDANGLHVNYKGGSAAVEAAGIRVDYSPGGTSGSTWNGLRIVADPSGAQPGVDSYGLNLEGPTTSNGGNDTAVKIASGWDIGLDIQSGGIQLADMGANPAAPPAGNLRLYAKNVAGRMLLKAEGSSGIDYPLQPSFFQNQIAMINVGTPGSCAAAGFNPFGLAITTSATTCTAPVSETLGYMKNMATAATANTGEYVYATNVMFYRGSIANGANGFFFNARIAMPDSTATYAGSSRTFVGLTDKATTVPIASDNAAGNRVGFSFANAGTGRTDTNWQISTKDGTTEHLTDTGLALTGGDVYDVYLYCPKQCTSINWRIDDITAGTSQQDIATGVTGNLPSASTALRPYYGLYTTSAVIHNIMMNRIYVESDR